MYCECTQDLPHCWHAPQICFQEHLASQSLAAEAHQLWHPEIITISTLLHWLQLWWPLPNIFPILYFLFITCSFGPRRCPCCKENYQTQEFHRCWVIFTCIMSKNSTRLLIIFSLSPPPGPHCTTAPIDLIQRGQACHVPQKVQWLRTPNQINLLGLRLTPRVLRPGQSEPKLWG